MKRLANEFGKLRIEHLWALTVVVGVFAFVNTHPIRPHDFWWHMAIGRQIIAQGQIPTLDVYSFTLPGQPYLSYFTYWWMEIALYRIYTWGGAAWIVLFQSFLITSAYAIVTWLGWRFSGSWRAAAFGAFFAAALGLGNWNVRPQAVTYLLGALILLATYEYQRSKKWAWLIVIPLAMLIWVNSHGTFLLGLALLGIWLVDQARQGWKAARTQASAARWRALGNSLAMPLLASGLGVVACLLNPRGLGIFSYVSGMFANSVIQSYIPEWSPPSFATLDGALFLGGLLLFATLQAATPAGAQPRPGIYQTLAFLLFGILGLRYIRGAVWFGLVLGPFAAAHAGAWMNQYLADRPASSQPANPALLRRMNGIFLILIIGMALISLPWFKPGLPLPAAKQGLISAETPVQAVQYLLDEHLPPQVFHDMAFGSYLIWAAAPDYQVFVDPRIEYYPAQIWNDYLRISAAQSGWQDILDHYQINTLLLDPIGQAALVNAARQSSAWQEVYNDPAAVVFVRR